MTSVLGFTVEEGLADIYTKYKSLQGNFLHLTLTFAALEDIGPDKTESMVVHKWRDCCR